MPRTCTSTERSTIAGAHVNHYLKLEVADADGVLRDCSALGTLSLDLLDGVQWGETIGSPVGTGTLTIRRDTNGDTAAPTMGASSINRNSVGGYAPLFEKGRTIRISTATVAGGATPASGDWKEMVLGRIDRVQWQTDPITIDFSDLGAWIADAWIQTPTQFITKADPGAGPLLGTVIQSMLTATAIKDGPITLYQPVTALFQPYSTTPQQPDSLLTAIRNLAQEIGWECRYRYDASGVFRLTLYEPNRANTTPDWTIGPTEYREVTQLETTIADIRNYIKGYYNVSAANLGYTVSQDTASIAKYGLRFMQVSSNLITASTDMQALTDAILSDLSEAPTDQEIELPYFWPVQLGDLITFQANGDHYDTDQTIAVVGYQHTFANGEGSTKIQARGKVAGAYKQWLRRAAGSSDHTLTLRVVRSSASDSSVIARVYVADSQQVQGRTITVTATGDGVPAIVPGIATLTEMTDVVTDDLETTAYVEIAITKPAPDAPQGRVTFLVRSDDGMTATASIDIYQRGEYTVPVPAISFEAEGTEEDGTYEGCIHIKAAFEVNTARIEIYAAESTTSGQPAPTQSTGNLAGTITRHEGVIASADDWATEFDVPTGTGNYRKLVVVPYGPTGIKGDPVVVELQAVDTGTAPSAPPSSLTVTPSTVSGAARNTVAWTNGDPTAYTRVWRNGIMLERVAPGVTSLVDDEVSPDLAYDYKVQHILNGQTTAFNDAGATVIVTSTTPTLSAPSFVTPYPTGYDPAGVPEVAIRVTNPDPLASTVIRMNASTGDTGIFGEIATIPPGATDCTIAASDVGLASGDVRWFDCLARRGGYTDSVGSAHGSAVFGGGI